MMDRRKVKREESSKVVKCYIENILSNKRSEFDMFLRDISDTGLGLLWSKWLLCFRCPHSPAQGCVELVQCKIEKCELEPEYEIIKPGVEVVVNKNPDEKFEENGIPLYSGTVAWVEKSKDNTYFRCGIKFT